MKKLCAIVLALALAACAPAMALDLDGLNKALEGLGEKASEFGEAAGKAASEFGQVAGDVVSGWGDAIKSFSQDPGAFIDGNEFLSSVKAAADEAGQSLKEYWPTFKEALSGSVDALFDSDMTWNEKKEALKKYAELAIPYLKEAEFETPREEASHIVDLAVEYVEPLLASEGDWAGKQEMLAFLAQEIADKEAELRAQLANDAPALAALDALSDTLRSADQGSAEASLAAMKQALAAIK